MSEARLSPRQKQIVERMDAWQAIIMDSPHWTFGALKKGDKFIFFPLPGDNSGHGGFLGGANVFMKIGPYSTKGIVAGSVVVSEDNCVRMCDGAYSRMPDTMPVIQVIL